MPSINVILFGATGMVGEGVLHESLRHPDVESVLVIGRRTCGIQHKKLQEIVHQNFFDFTSIENRLRGYNACFFCLGVSSIGMAEADYRKTTYDLTMHAAAILSTVNPEMTFCYVSGLGTDSTEHGRSMWARVKGKTENDLMKLPFKSVYNFRPGFIKPIKGLKHALALSKLFDPLYPVFKLFFPKAVVTLEEVGLAMINAAGHGYGRNILECVDIRRLADSSTAL